MTTGEDSSAIEEDDSYHFVVAADAIDPGERVLVDIQDREIAVFNVDNTFHALSNYCIHQGGPVCEGTVTGTVTEDDDGLKYEKDGEIVSCPWHAWEFDIKTGRHLARPQYRLPTYEITVVDGKIYVRV